MKVFHATGYEDYGCGDYFSSEVTVVANTESEALGYLLDRYCYTKAGTWELEEVDMTKLGVYGD